MEMESLEDEADNPHEIENEPNNQVDIEKKTLIEKISFSNFCML